MCLCFEQLSGLTVVALAVWVLVAPDLKEALELSADVSNSGLLHVAAILLVVVGGLLFIISLLGIIGAVIEHKVILGTVRTTFCHRLIDFTLQDT